MLEYKIGHQGEGIESSEIRVRLDPIEYDVGIKVGGLSVDRNGEVSFIAVDQSTIYGHTSPATMLGFFISEVVDC